MRSPAIRLFAVSAMLALPVRSIAEFVPPGLDVTVDVPGEDVSYRPPQIEWMSDGTLWILYERSYADAGPGVDAGAYLLHVAQDGGSLGPPVRVSSVDGVVSQAPRFAKGPADTMVVVFQTLTPDAETGTPGPMKDGGGYGIFARPFAADGTALAQPFQVNAASAGDQYDGDVAYLGSDTWIALWTDGNYPTMTLRVRQFDLLGTSMGADAPIETTALRDSSLASGGSGTYAVGWSDLTGELNKVRMLDSDNQTIVSRVLGVSTHNFSTVVEPVMASDGTLVVRHANAFIGWQPKAEVIAADGSTIASDIAVGVEPIAIAPGGLWVSATDDEAHYAIYQTESMQQHETGGTPIGKAYAGRSDLSPMMAWDSAVAMNAYGSVAALYTATRDRNHFYDIGALPVEDTVRHYLRLFCDSTDPQCDPCTAGDATDLDGDGLADACDPCVTPAGAPAISFASAAIRNAERANLFPQRANQVRVRAVAALTPGTFASLPLVDRGLRMRIDSADGGSLVDAQLPGGTWAGNGTRGWTVKPGVYLYRDSTLEPVLGFRKVIVQDSSARSPGLVTVRATATASQYGVRPGYLPMVLSVTFGEHADGNAGLCTEFPFDAAECEAEMTASQSGRLRCLTQ